LQKGAGCHIKKSNIMKIKKKLLPVNADDIIIKVMVYGLLSLVTINALVGLVWLFLWMVNNMPGN